MRAVLQPRKEHAMDNILDILQALALAASTARTKLELWWEITHMSDEWGEIKPGGNRAL